jgi:C1A family cysteine protease
MKKIALRCVLSVTLVLPATARNLPVSFDLRDVGGVNYVSSIKDQLGGTCWTHGAMASIESNLMMSGAWTAAGDTGEPNLSEYHLDWWNGFNQFNNDDLDPPTGDGLEVHMGGDFLVTAAYLSRGEGAVRDVDGQLFYVAPPRWEDGFHHYYVRDIEWLNAGENVETIDEIKEAVMNYGVVATAMCYASEFMNEYFVHYQPPSDEYLPNHAVAIVGWNDTLTTQAPLPGAWLCKNSWGEDWGYDGFFWISYYDKICGHDAEMGAVSFYNVVPLPYDYVYYHDYHGWRETLDGYNSAFNAFVVPEDQVLQAVSFYTTADSAEYVVKIYDDFQDGALLNQLTGVSGYCEHKGLHTADLDSSLPLTEGNDFYISVELSRGGLAYDKTSEVDVLLGAKYRTIVTSAASTGESYYLDASNWQDLHEIDTTANFCIKGLATANPKLDYIYPNGLPDFVAPGHDLQITVRIKNGTETLAAGSPCLHYRFHGGAFLISSLQPLGPGYYRATIPATVCDAAPEYYFSAQTQSGLTVLSPHTAPDSLFHVTVGENYIQIDDDFETDQGWMTENLGATDGDWERGVPVADPDWIWAPANDADGSGQCYVTGNEMGQSDVDRGSVRLTSPVFSMFGGGTLSYFYFLYISYASDGTDLILVEMSDDGGDQWTEITRHEHSTRLMWKHYAIEDSEILAAGLALTDSMRVRYTATDGGAQSIVEAGIDGFLVQALSCNDSYTCGDADGNHVVNISDAVHLIAFIFGGGPIPSPLEAGDADCNNIVNISDAVYLIAYIFGGGPAPCAGCE